MMRILFHIFTLLLITSVTYGQEIKYDSDIRKSFIENKGQWPLDVHFNTPMEGGNVWIQNGKIVYHFLDLSSVAEVHANFNVPHQTPEIKQHVLHQNFIGAQKFVGTEKSGQSLNYFNFFKGNNPEKWSKEVRGYQEVVLKQLYPNIDLKLIQETSGLKYEFIVNPGANPRTIRWNYAGAKKSKITATGELVVTTPLGEIQEEKPIAYQIINGRIINVDCQFSMKNDEFFFELGEYREEYQLVIDPTLIFSTYCGSFTDNFGMTATYGQDGTALSGGVVYGNNYPTPDGNAFDVNSNFTVANGPTYGITDVYLSKYNSTGTTMLWTTYLGGGDDNQGTETVHSLITDSQNNIYLYGATSSIDFPTQNAYQNSHAGGTANSNFFQNGVYFTNQGTDIFVARISANGQNLLGSTYIGGSLNDGVNYKVSSGFYSAASAYDSLTTNYGDQFRGEIILDSVGNCIVTSCSRSANFPMVNAFQPTIGGQQDAVVFKLSPNLSTLLFSSYYGGTGNDAGYSAKVNKAGNILFSGGTTSANLAATASGWQSTYNGGVADGFVAKIDGFTHNLLAATYIGTTNYDQCFFVETDRENNVYLVGQSRGGQFPVINATYSNPNSAQFILKMDDALSNVLNSTVIGNGNGQINISPSAFLVDICGSIYLSGWGANLLQSTPLTGMPTTSNGLQQVPPNGFDFYLFVMTNTFDQVLYGSYLGGSLAREHVDGGTSRFDKNGVVYQCVCAGCGGHSDFPTTPGAWSADNLSTNCNNLVFKFDFDLIPDAEFTVDDNIGCADFTVTFSNFSTQSDEYLWDFGNNDTTSVIFNPIITYDQPGVYEVYLYVTDSVCQLTDTAQITITVTDPIQLDASSDLELCDALPQTLTANSYGTASYFVWSSNANFSDTLNSSLSDSTYSFTPTTNGVYYVLAGNAGCNAIDSVQITFVNSALNLEGDTLLCLGENTTITASSTNPNIQFTYSWSPSTIIVSQPSNESVVVQPNSTTYLVCTALSNLGCLVEDSIQIFVSDIPDGTIVASAGDSLVPFGGSTTLTVQPSGLSYQWTPTNGIENPTSAQTSITLDSPTQVIVFGTDGICTKSDTLFIDVFSFICEEPYVFVPNAFSPNGDNVNDVLYVRSPILARLIFRVYNRWGELMFESTDLHTGWDGTYKGKPMDPDVYDYYLDIECIDGMKNIIKGNITLIK